MRVRTAAALMSSGLLVGACGGDAPPGQSSPDEAAPTVTASPSVASSRGEDRSAALRAAVTAYSDAVLTGDGETAHGLLSARCARSTGRGELDAAVAEAEDRYGTALPVEFVDLNRAGTWATVTYRYAASELDKESERWSFEAGEWRYDDCAP